VAAALSRLGAIAPAATTIVGCGAPENDNGVESVTQALTVGNWSFGECCGN
jgi:hypothetical protein